MMPLISSNNELERMQQLAKLVHSMQLVNDHIQSEFSVSIRQFICYYFYF